MITTSRRAHGLRASPTLAEQKLWRLLRVLNRHGAHWRRQAQLGDYVFDFAWLSARALIELDGGVHVLRRPLDATKAVWATDRGFHLLRLTNSDVRTPVEQTLPQRGRVGRGRERHRPEVKPKRMLYVLAYPELDAADRADLEAVRAEFEPDRAKMVRAHVTLMFGTSAVTTARLIEIATSVAQDLDIFAVDLAERRIVFDPIDHTYKVFLITTQGGDTIARVFRAIRAELPTSTLRDDVPFIPHVTIATCADRATAQDACDAAERIALPVRGVIEALEVVELKGADLRPLASLPLRRAGL